MEPADNARPDPRQAAGRAEENRQLRDAVMALPDDLRQAVLLHYAEGLSAGDIARMNGEARSTVTRRLDKARQLLRQHLESGLAANLAASVQQLRPRHASLQRTLGIITAATALPAATRAQLLQLVADTPFPPLVDPVTSAATAAHFKEAGIMKGIIAKAGAGKLLAAIGAAAFVVGGGAYALKNLSVDSAPITGSYYTTRGSINPDTRITHFNHTAPNTRRAAGELALPSSTSSSATDGNRRRRVSPSERIALLKTDLISTQPELVRQVGETTETLFLNMHVVNESGLPVKDAIVRIPRYGWRSSQYTSTIARAPDDIIDYPTNEHGIARVDVPAGSSIVKTTHLTAEASHPDYASTKAEMAFTSVTKLVLTTGANLEIMPVNGLTSAPIVSSVQPEFAATFKPEWYTRSDGTIVVRKLADPQARFYLTHSNNAGELSKSVVHNVRLPRMEDTPLQVPLYPARTIQGRLSDNVPRPVEDVTVRYMHLLANQDTLGMTSATVDVEPDGTFSIDDVVHGTTVSIAALGANFTSVPPSDNRSGRFARDYLVEQNTHSIELPMIPTSTAVVTLKTPNGDALSSAALSYYVGFITEGWIPNMKSGRITSNNEGVAIISSLPPLRTIRLDLEHPDWQLPVLSQALGAVSAIDMSSGGVVEVLITVARKPVSVDGSIMFVVPEGGSIRYTQTSGHTSKPGI